MQKIITLTLAMVIQLCCFAQTENKSIRISKNLELVRLTDNTYLHISYSELPNYGWFPSNGLIFTSSTEALLLDTPITDSLTSNLVTWITDSMKLRIVGFVPNHWHNDCIGGLAVLHNKNIKTYANQITIDIAKLQRLPVPQQGFTDSLQLKVGDKSIMCYYLGAAHTLDNIVVWIPSEQILFAGCMVKSLYSKDLGNVTDGDLELYPKTIDKLLSKFPKAKIVIPGHGQYGGLELIRYTKELSSRKL